MSARTGAVLRKCCWVVLLVSGVHLAPHATATPIGQVAVAPLNPNVLAAIVAPRDGSGYQVRTSRAVLSRDGGRTWRQIAAPADATRFEWLVPLGTGATLAATVEGDDYRDRLVVSRNGGRTWTMPEGVPEIDTSDTAIVADRGRRGWAWACHGFGSRRLYVTRDAGRSWGPVRTVSTGCQVLTSQPRRNGDIFVRQNVSPGGPTLRSTNGGRSWQRLTGPPVTLFDIVYDGDRPETMVACSLGVPGASYNELALWRSTDSGRTWRLALQPPPGYGLVRTSWGGGRFVADLFRDSNSGGPPVHLASSDHGATWQRLRAPGTRRTAPQTGRYAAGTASALYAPSTAGLWVLRRGAGNWALVRIP